MTNPWEKLEENEYILSDDIENIEEFNKTLPQSKTDAEIRTDQLPGPYLGNPFNAKVVILSLNPGYSEEDTVLHQEEKFKNDLRANLLHNPIEYPFYYLNPEKPFKDCGGQRFWQPILQPIINAISNEGLDQKESVKLIANRVAVIQWFPYHSKAILSLQKKLEDLKLKSQEYSFYLAKCVMENKKIIIVHRSLADWKKSLSQCFTENEFNKNIMTHTSGKAPRNWHFRKEYFNNDNFKKICDAILSDQ